MLLVLPAIHARALAWRDHAGKIYFLCLLVEGAMVKVAVAGASGYTGVELLRLLVGHPQVDICAVTSRQHEGVAVNRIFPSLSGFCHVGL